MIIPIVLPVSLKGAFEHLPTDVLLKIKEMCSITNLVICVCFVVLTGIFIKTINDR